MCGIVGLFLKNKALEPELGRMMSGMLATMCDRGPDSAGFAVYGTGDNGHVKLTVGAGRQWPREARGGGAPPELLFREPRRPALRSRRLSRAGGSSRKPRRIHR